MLGDAESIPSLPVWLPDERVIPRREEGVQRIVERPPAWLSENGENENERERTKRMKEALDGGYRWKLEKGRSDRWMP